MSVDVSPVKYSEKHILISRSVSESPLEFEITRVDCSFPFKGGSSVVVFYNYASVF